jgi:hypothetical protein
VAVLEAIYGVVFPEDKEDCNNEKLDGEIAKIDDRNTTDTEIKRLAKLQPIDYDRQREDAAKKLGCRVGTLDHSVERERGEGAGTSRLGKGRPIDLPNAEPWANSVDGAALLNGLSSTVREYVIISDTQADAVALWIVHTHAHDASDVSPKLILKSAQKRSGKTRLVGLLERLVAKPISVSGITAAALLRIIEMHAPTLLLDEMDAAMKQSRELAEALRGLINSGFDRAGARFVMNVPTADGSFEPRQFSTWAPQVLSGIGSLPDTIRDRSIQIDMVRKRTGEKVKRLRRRDGADLHDLGRQSARWAIDNVEALRNSTPEIPAGMDDRTADAWEPLLAIADRASGEWPTRARKATVALSANDVIEDDNVGTTLLADIRAIFATDDRVHATRHDRQITSESLVDALVAMEEHPWAEFGRARKPISKNGLARLLKPYRIGPGTIRTGPGEGDTAKGYKLSQFADAFERYLPGLADQAVTPSQSPNDGHFHGFESVTTPDDVTAQKSQKPNDGGQCDGVTAGEADLATEEASWTV